MRGQNIVDVIFSINHYVYRNQRSGSFSFLKMPPQMLINAYSPLVCSRIFSQGIFRLFFSIADVSAVFLTY